MNKETLGNADGLVDAGVTLITIGIGGPDYDLGPLKELIQWRDGVRKRQEG